MAVTERPSKPAQKSNSPGTTTWFGFARRVPTERGTIRIRLLWGRITALVLALMVIGWFSVATALYFFYREVREFEEVAFKDMILFPIRRDAVREQQGNYEIEQAIARIEAGDYQRGVMLARQGIRRSPANTEGRFLLARLYSGIRPDVSIELLESGLEYVDDDVDYLRLYITLLLQEKQDEKVLELVRSYLAREDLSEQVKSIFALSGMRASLFRGHYEEAARLFVDYDLWRNVEGVTLAASLLNRVGETDRAIEFLRRFTEVFQDQAIEPVHTALLRILVEEERFDEAAEIALSRSLRNPLDWQPRLDLLSVHQKSGRTERARREALDLARQFRSDARVMAALAQHATDAGDVALARRVYESALENNHSVAIFGLLLIEAHITAGEYQAAIRFCNELVREQPGWLRDYETVFSSMRSIATYAAGNEELGRVYLREFTDSPRTTSGIMVNVAKRFKEIGWPEIARQLLVEAVRRDDGSEAALAGLIELELDLGESLALTDHVRQLLQLRRPSHDLLERLYRELGSDRFLFTPGREELLSALNEVLAERDVDVTDVRLPS